MSKGIVVAQKDIPHKQNLLGQYFTPEKVASFCLDKTKHISNLIIEPSCGNGQFLNKLSAPRVIGIEVDPEIAGENVLVMNFYDYNEQFNECVTFIGNPPYRTPAFSLRDRRDFVKALMKKYQIVNMREEAVFFIVKTVDLIRESNVEGFIHYIVPKTIFRNNSRAYLSFIRFLKENLNLISVYDLDKDFEGVTTDLVYVSWKIGKQEPKYLHNDVECDIDDFYGVSEDFIPFQKIFKVTNLGSVPCESIFLSNENEPIESFRERLIRIFDKGTKINEDNLIDYLSYNGKVHLTALQNNNQDKIRVVLGYINNVKNLKEGMFDNWDSYKPIRHRKENRYYFRNRSLKKAGFVYELNRNPCPSFYFPGNPNKGSTDYFGFCEYDVNRNSSPGANRTIPLANVENNLHEEFKQYWRKNTGKMPYERVFDYLLYIANSQWYKSLKKKYQRFYFGIPKEFDSGFLERVYVRS